MDDVFNYADQDGDNHLDAEEFQMIYDHKDEDYDYNQDTEAQDLWMRHSEGDSDRASYRRMTRDGFANAYREGVEGISDEDIDAAWSQALIWGGD